VRDEGTWIVPGIERAYGELHALGWAHSVEVWEAGPRGRELVGGIYGVAIGGAFAGESMFHRRTDASKVAFARLVERLRAGGFTLFDVQVQTDHLASLGCVVVTRDAYLRRLDAALRQTARLG
jgi:leucyl/phenylalanyl-tRNA--protein transferase